MSFSLQNSALLTDLYQLTMAYGYWRCGVAETEATFHLSFRNAPFDGGYVVACGLQDAIDYLERFRFERSDLDYLASLRGADGEPLFCEHFLKFLDEQRLSCKAFAPPEGTVVFPHEPVLRIEGPILQCQILETPLLNIINFQSLIATKAARVCQAAGDDDVLEFGLRRAQGFNGAVAASRAAFIGGCSATSNVLAGKLLGIPVRGTHAHSWVMLFDDERRAFAAYAEAMPNNCLLLVDTYDSLNGVKNAIETAKQLEQHGHRLLGIRLDSGDLAYLSVRARQMLDAAGLVDTLIVASNDLDEHIISSLKQQGARIDVWGVGTKLVTSFDQPALGGVYKLSAVRARAELPWEPRIKLSEQAAKISTPGVLQVRRFIEGDAYCGDMIYAVDQPPTGGPYTIVDPFDLTRRKQISANCRYDDLLQEVYAAQRRTAPPPTLEQSRALVRRQLAALHPSIKRFVNPHQYPVGLEPTLHQRRTDLIIAARQQTRGATRA